MWGPPSFGSARPRGGLREAKAAVKGGGPEWKAEVKTEAMKGRRIRETAPVGGRPGRKPRADRVLVDLAMPRVDVPIRIPVETQEPQPQV